MPSRRKNSSLAMVDAVLYIARIAFGMSVSFIVLCIIALLLGVGEGERVILTLSIVLNLVVAIGSMILKKCMLKSSAKFDQKRKKKDGKTIDMWLKNK